MSQGTTRQRARERRAESSSPEWGCFAVWAILHPRCGGRSWPAPAAWRPSRALTLRVSRSPSPPKSRTSIPSSSWTRRKRARWGASFTTPLPLSQEALAQSGLADRRRECRPRGRLHRLRHRRIRSHRARAQQPAAGRPAQDVALLHSRGHREHGRRARSAFATARAAPSRPRPRPAPPAPTPSATRCA